MRKWVINNLDKGSSSLFSTIYELMYKSVGFSQSVPQSILIIVVISINLLSQTKKLIWLHV